MPLLLLLIIVTAALSPQAHAGIVINLPYEENFDSGTYQSSLTWVSEGATHQWLPSGGWFGGGAAKFTPPTNGQGYSGLGLFDIANRSNQLNVRFLIYWGARYTIDSSFEGNKWVIANRASGLDDDRLIAMQHSYYESSWQPGICQNIECSYRPDSKFDISQWTEQWISVEFEGIIDSGVMRVYISTQDGTYNDTVYLDVDNPMRSSQWDMIQIIGGYFNGGATASSDNYYLIDELRIDSRHIGPLIGFIAAGPDVSFSSNASAVESGGSVSLTWNAPNASGCTASGSWNGDKGTSGTEVITNITSAQTYTLVCSNTEGETSRSVSVSIKAPLPADDTPPSDPINVNWLALSNTQVDLAWSPSTDSGSGLSGYRVYRDGTLIGNAATTRYSDVLLPGGSEYTYEITAIDNAGNESARSSVVALTQSAGDAVYRINAGGSAYTDSFGRVWAADSGANTGNQDSVSARISGTSEERLFQSQRWDASGAPELQYSFTLANGQYTVNLYFAETYSGAFGTGLRTMDVYVEGILQLDDLDVYAEAGANTALAKSFSATVTDAQLDIAWVHGVDNPMVSAIEVLQESISDGSSPQPAAPTVTFTADPLTVSSGGSVVLSWSSSNAMNCTASGDENWIGGKSPSGSETLGPLTQNRTYMLSCSGAGGTLQRSVQVQVSAVDNGGNENEGNGNGVPNGESQGGGALHPLIVLAWLVFGGLGKMRLPYGGA